MATNAADYAVGEHLILVGMWGGEWPVEVVGHTSLPDDLVVRWTGMAPSLDDVNTICLAHLKEVRRAG